uniref:Phosphoglycerate mutase n=1 Tax=Chaetoceros debilis TaxID=122233 RepID=A0A7S3V4D9_9STRA|mmetsp:Transcript_24540/g.36390  ORF Transcript_24540/g.36390 Transcript_24540/m.36390 type:complete len:291 (-) Transcript_24540:123-995(-)|eukprot:CAMPEP_0194077556 /NCGR_PEP_ID=MMETSP0149-20130528/4167_1 /TAXON_ID=122233 /ORGANISM="Chaetoceros debilis, Strain MM31A-1" /LENGTH=290 /DNA_ID=CAMNT_0038758619 /DNA_START=63 /DNA_END=935 /DNA_ORIENTATION=-
MTITEKVDTSTAPSSGGFLSRLCGAGTTTQSQAKGPYTLILIRHGESEWNIANKFTGWYDCPLSPEGVEEVIEAGKLIKAEGLEMDVAFTSMLKRAIVTLHHVLEQNDSLWIPVEKAWQLNERHYGGLTGLDKIKTVEKHGEEQVLIWRRSYDIPPPAAPKTSEYHPGNDKRYSNLTFPDEFTETLATTLERVLPYYENKIVPQLKAGKTVVVAAHGNSLRALVKHLDGIDEKTIPNLNIPTGVPLVYKLDENLDVIPSEVAMFPLRGRYLGDQDQIKARIEGVQNQTKK